MTGFLYFLVFEREELIAFAQTSGTEAADDAPETSEEAAGLAKIIRVFALKSEARQIDSAVIMRGETEAARSVEVRAQTSGRVVSEPLRKGSYVTAEQMLCQIDVGTREASLAEAIARLAEARARVPEAQARLDEAMARLDEAKINDNAASKLSEGGFASETRVASAQAACVPQKLPLPLPKVVCKALVPASKAQKQPSQACKKTLIDSRSPPPLKAYWKQIRQSLAV